MTENCNFIDFQRMRIGCGISTRSQSRLDPAQSSDPRDWPWMASVTVKHFTVYCGGVLITDWHVLTAAHCTNKWKAEDFRVRLGEYDMQRSNESRTYNFLVTEIRQHVDYELAIFRNDIAILKLDRPATFNSYVWPICLPPLGMSLTNQSAYVIGWGTTNAGEPTSNVLREVSVPIWKHERCVETYVEPILNEHMCAGSTGKDACQRDSGGPLMIQLPSGRWTVVGLVSRGVGCGNINRPGIYTRVDRFLSWIVLNVNF